MINVLKDLVRRESVWRGHGIRVPCVPLTTLLDAGR